MLCGRRLGGKEVVWTRTGVLTGDGVVFVFV